MDPEKEEFLKEFGGDYGYPTGPKSIDQIRATEFKRLDGQIFSLSFQRRFQYFIYLVIVIIFLVLVKLSVWLLRKLKKTIAVNESSCS